MNVSDCDRRSPGDHGRDFRGPGDVGRPGDVGGPRDCARDATVCAVGVHDAGQRNLFERPARVLLQLLVVPRVQRRHHVGWLVLPLVLWQRRVRRQRLHERRICRKLLGRREFQGNGKKIGLDDWVFDYGLMLVQFLQLARHERREGA